MNELSFSSAYQWVISNGMHFISGVLTLIIGLWIIKFLTGKMVGVMKKKDVDPTLQPYLKNLFSITLKILLVVSVMSMVGIKMTSFIAILGAAGLAIGMALSGTLQNFAGGILILILKPYKVGDFIEAQDKMGTVKEIQIFHTILKTPDNKITIIPNGPLSTDSLTNFSKEDTRRIDFCFNVDYSSNIKLAKRVISEILSQDKRIFTDPKPFIAISELAESAMKLTVRVWAKADDYWDIYFDMPEKVKDAFDENEIIIPFPQKTVTIIKENNQNK